MVTEGERETNLAQYHLLAYLLTKIGERFRTTAELRGEHTGGGLVAGDLAAGELAPVKHCPCLCVSDRWGLSTLGPRVSHSGAPSRMHLAWLVCDLFVFLFFFFRI